MHINCQKCGAEDIPESFPVCPHCGHRINESIIYYVLEYLSKLISKNKNKLIYILVIFMLFMFFLQYDALKKLILHYSLEGTLSLFDSKIKGISNYCYGTGGYSDIKGGMVVTIKDESGKIIAVGETSHGTRSDNILGTMCMFSFTVDSIPKANFYTVEIGRRGKLTYSFDDMKKIEWNISLTIGL